MAAMVGGSFVACAAALTFSASVVIRVQARCRATSSPGRNWGAR
ncbi:rCG35843, isoform CRA_b [Rattus norvegicus]|uniref:RCG35843, isoform CRA_b n=1 Tax=Rattus norvegicus TaxID=10116 RepID=A6IKV0_RAT|nr:rCG35843, isoform CRA_b [Rattus norvegicus]